ncbi:hypothetical protein BE20_28440 [Sorangium cellulosum]|nr:hypothetical protein BE20_28440 [Sorangium cellulosum]
MTWRWWTESMMWATDAAIRSADARLSRCDRIMSLSDRPPLSSMISARPFPCFPTSITTGMPGTRRSRMSACSCRILASSRGSGYSLLRSFTATGSRSALR